MLASTTVFMGFPVVGGCLSSFSFSGLAGDPVSVPVIVLISVGTVGVVFDSVESFSSSIGWLGWLIVQPFPTRSGVEGGCIWMDCCAILWSSCVATGGVPVSWRHGEGCG